MNCLMFDGRMETMTNPLVKILVVIGSSASIDFGIWQFFVPKPGSGIHISICRLQRG